MSYMHTRLHGTTTTKTPDHADPQNNMCERKPLIGVTLDLISEQLWLCQNIRMWWSLPQHRICNGPNLVWIHASIYPQGHQWYLHWPSQYSFNIPQQLMHVIL